MSSPILDCAFRRDFGAFGLDVQLALPLSGVAAVFGPSGSGKSLLLRCIAGLERAAGHLRCGDVQWQDGERITPAHRRGIGYVPQEPTLFPHLDVRGNLEYGLHRSADARLALDDVVDPLGLRPLLAQRPETLSGGQRQRVAIGRALLCSPRLLLLDEPLAALDLPARRSLLADIGRVRRKLGLPMLYVTHAADEVERIADRVVFIEHGRVVGVQALAETAARLDSRLFADDGPVAVFDAAVAGFDHALCALEVEHQGLRMRLPAARRPDGPVRMRIAARDVALARQRPAEASFQNVIPVAVDAVHAWRPGRVIIECRSDDGVRLFAELVGAAVQALALAPGDRVFALVKAVALVD
jgi:molybdate transport system ATP-binding protein